MPSEHYVLLEKATRIAYRSRQRVRLLGKEAGRAAEMKPMKPWRVAHGPKQERAVATATSFPLSSHQRVLGAHSGQAQLQGLGCSNKTNTSVPWGSQTPNYHRRK